MGKRPIIEVGTTFEWCNDGIRTEVTDIRYIDEDGQVHLTVQNEEGESYNITAHDIYHKLDMGGLERV
jgi:hypothetical protein